MTVSPVLIVGAAFFMFGVLTFMVLLFGSGGVKKSRQFAVIGQLFRGEHGGGKRIATFAALAAVGLGAVLCFAGIAAGDRARAERCQQHCETEGFSEGVIGPSIDRDPQTRFVACTCSGGTDGTLELRAHDL